MRAKLACVLGAALLFAGCAAAAPAPPSPSGDATPTASASAATSSPGTIIAGVPCAKQPEPLLCMFLEAADLDHVDLADGAAATARVVGAMSESFRGCDALVVEACARGGFLMLTFLALDKHGRLSPEDHVRATEKGLTMLRRGCDGGAPRGCLVLAVLYESGHYVDASAVRAAEYYGRACKGGIDAACAGKVGSRRSEGTQ